MRPPKNIRFAKSLPHAFSEHGAIQAANMLNSDAAIEIGLYVVRAFVRLTQWLSMQKAFAAKLDELEQRVGAHDEQLAAVIEALRLFTAPPQCRVQPKNRISQRKPLTTPCLPPQRSTPSLAPRPAIRAKHVPRTTINAASPTSYNAKDSSRH